MFIGQLAFCASGNKRLSIACSMIPTLPDTIILYTDEHFDTSGILSVFPIAFCKGLTSILQQKANTTRAFVHCMSAPSSAGRQCWSQCVQLCLGCMHEQRRDGPGRNDLPGAVLPMLCLSFSLTIPYCFPLLSCGSGDASEKRGDIGHLQHVLPFSGLRLTLLKPRL